MAPYVPTPAAPYAGHQWYYRWLEHLAAHADITLVAPNDDGAAACVPAVTSLGVEVHLVDRHRATGSATEDALRRRGRYLALQQVVPSDSAVDALYRSADVLDVQWAEMLFEVRRARRLGVRARITAVEHDVHFATLTWSRLAAEPPLRRVVSAAAGRMLRRSEVSALSRCDAVFTFTDDDAGRLRQAGLATAPSVLGPWLAAPGGPVVPVAPPEVVFVGAMDRRPNIEAVGWLIDEVWPEVATQVPEAVLVVAGGGASESLRSAAGPSVRFTGYVDDLDVVYRRASVVVAPVFAGAGLRFKVPQAMRYGMPLVVTPMALEGLADAPTDALLACSDDASTFAGAVVRGLTERGYADATGAVAQSWVKQRFSFDAVIAKALEVWRV